MARNRKAQRVSREEKKKKRKMITISIVLVFLMTFGIIGFGQNQNRSGQESNKFQYNGFDFSVRQVENGNVIFIAEQNGQEIGFFYNQPLETEDINLSSEFRSDLMNAGTIVFASKPLPLDGNAGKDVVYQNLVVQHIGSTTGKNIIRGSTEDSLFSDLPFYDCDSASAESPVVIFKEEPKDVGVFNTEVEHCYELHATGIDLLRMRDKIIYTFLGVQ